MDTPSVSELLRTVEALAARVEALEARVSEDDRVPPDVVLAISAAVAAYLGKRATLRQVHLRRSPAWTQQGRAAVQTSHLVIHGVR